MLQVEGSAELVFVDSSGGMEEYNLRVFLIVTHSPVGALPLGIIVTSDETTDTLTRAFELFSSTLQQDNSFFGKGAMAGPTVIMTDNCVELRDALHAVWPRSHLLLCVFHIMQQVWRWLFDKKHGINNNHRQGMKIMLNHYTCIFGSSYIFCTKPFCVLLKLII